MILCHNIFTRFFVVVVLIAMMGRKVGAFTGRTCSSSREQMVETTLSAWSLPNPSDFASFATMKKSTWYDEYNPTARRTVYNDSRLSDDLTFSNLGTDWPSFWEELEPHEVTASEASAPPRRNRNPLRRVAGLASRLRRRA